MNLIITGPQASGKGTQADLLAEKLGLSHLAIGETFRKIAQEKSSVGKKVDEYINKRGDLVPEEITTKVVASFLDKNLKNGVVFDGYPRTEKQLEVLKELLEKRQESIDKVFYINISEKEIERRLSGRLVCPKCGENYNVLTAPPKKEGLCDVCQVKLVRRKDENPTAIQKRLSIYRKETAPLLKKYRQMGILEEVDGERPIKVIFEDILGRLKKAGLVR